MARDRRLRLLVGVLSASTLIEGMVDVLVVVTALELIDLGGAGVGWLNAAWGVGGLAGGAVALTLVARGRLRLALPVGGLLIGLPLIALGVAPAPGRRAGRCCSCSGSATRWSRSPGSRCCSDSRTTASAPARSPSSRARTG